jgi:hypothetical protein
VQDSAIMAESFAIRQSKTNLARDKHFNSFPRADSLLKTRRETRTVRFIGICRCVDIRQIDSARSNVCFAV